MQIALFGATGLSGQEFVEEALERGHEILALVRNPDKFSIQNEKLQVEKVNVFNAEELAPHLRGCDAVTSCIGLQGAFIRGEVTLYYESMKSIVAAMRISEVKRLICMSSWCTVRQPNSLKIYEWIIKPLLVGPKLENMAVMEKYLEDECKDIDYTVVRPPMLVNGPSTGKPILTEEGQFVKEITAIMAKTPRRDVVKFMLNCLENGEWKQKFVAIGIQ